MAESETTLTEKQLRFCREYAAEPNGVQSYLRAFGRKMSYHVASESARRLLEKPAIQEEIEAARKDYMRRVRLSATRILRGMVEIALADMDDCFEADEANGGLPVPRPWAEVPPATRRAMQGVKVKRKRIVGKGKGETTDWEIEEIEYKFPDKNAAFEKLCKHLGLTKDGVALEAILAAIRGGNQATADATPEKGTGGGDTISDLKSVK